MVRWPIAVGQVMGVARKPAGHPAKRGGLSRKAKTASAHATPLADAGERLKFRPFMPTNP